MDSQLQQFQLTELEERLEMSSAAGTDWSSPCCHLCGGACENPV